MIDIPTALIKISNRELLIIVDDEDRENEGDFFIPTQHLTPEYVNLMTKIGRGLICISLPEHRLTKLGIPPMTVNNTCAHGTAFHLSCEAKEGVTTGISAFDRHTTMQKLIDSSASSADFVFPGHVFPLRACENGVIERKGHTEASADLASLAGLKPSGVIVEIMDESGHMARLPRLTEIAKDLNIAIVTIEDLVKYRLEHKLTKSLYTKW